MSDETEISPVEEADPENQPPKRPWEITEACSGRYAGTKRCPKWVSNQCEALRTLDFNYLSACIGTFLTLSWVYDYCKRHYLGVDPSNSDPADRYVPDPLIEVMPKTQLSYHDNLVMNRIGKMTRGKWRRVHRSTRDWSNYLLVAGKNLCLDMLKATTRCRECTEYDTLAKTCSVGVVTKAGKACPEYRSIPKDNPIVPIPPPDVLHDLREIYIIKRRAGDRLRRLVYDKSLRYPSRRERRVPLLLDLILRCYDPKADIDKIAKELRVSIAEAKHTYAVLKNWIAEGQFRDDEVLQEAMDMLRDFVEPAGVSVIVRSDTLADD